jgi:hypothetical protein
MFRRIFDVLRKHLIFASPENHFQSILLLPEILCSLTGVVGAFAISQIV